MVSVLMGGGGGVVLHIVSWPIGNISVKFHFCAWLHSSNRVLISILINKTDYVTLNQKHELWSLIAIAGCIYRNLHSTYDSVAFLSK